MTRIGQDTEAVHLTDEGGSALCGAAASGESLPAGQWAAGLTPATLGARVCEACSAETRAAMGSGEADGPRRSAASRLMPRSGDVA